MSEFVRARTKLLYSRWPAGVPRGCWMTHALMALRPTAPFPCNDIVLTADEALQVLVNAPPKPSPALREAMKRRR